MEGAAVLSFHQVKTNCIQDFLGLFAEKLDNPISLTIFKSWA
jgi:hypothetical protein